MSTSTMRSALMMIVIGVGVVAAMAWGPDTEHPQREQSRPPNATAQQAFPDLMGGLKNSPGCLGVEAAQTMSGKKVIFAWFENKKALKNWYYGDTHMQAVQMFFPEHEELDEPLKGRPDDFGPIMAVASITMAEQPQLEQTTLPVSQIAIELYQPINGGLYLGGRFAPKSMKVKDMHDLTPADMKDTQP